MENLMNMLMSQLGGSAIEQVSQRLGADSNTTQTALNAAIPLLMSALARNAANPDGAQALQQAVTRDHDGSILDNVMDFLGNPESANGAGILRHVLGGQQESIQTALGQSTGLNAGQIGQLLQIAAPLVMGAIGKTTQQQHLDANGLSQFLGQQQQAVAAQAPDLMSIATKFLDANGNGTILDEAAGLLGNLFNRK
jgi:hypothetical protein